MDAQTLPNLLCLMLFVGSVFMEEDTIQVEISGRSVTISCPQVDSDVDFTDYTLIHNGKEISSPVDNYGDANNGLYECSRKSPKTHKYLYLKAQVCDTCTEVPAPVVVGVLVADCMVTFGVALAVYFGCKKSAVRSRDGGMANGARQKGRSEGPPPVPNPDYEPIRKGPRDEYDRLGQRFK
ncbi:T-cell surface glycoprotein CD3 epsilon chain [Discoglossus pictus]